MKGKIIIKFSITAIIILLFIISIMYTRTEEGCLEHTAKKYCDTFKDSFGGLIENNTMFLCKDSSNLRDNPYITSSYGKYFLPEEKINCKNWGKMHNKINKLFNIQ